MRTHATVALAMMAGVGIGAGAVQVLHAQAQPPVYYVAEIDVTNAEGYSKEYVPKAQALIRSHGGRILAAGGTGGGTTGKVTTLEGDAPKRVVVQQWESMAKLQAWRSDQEFVAHRKVGEQFAKFRSFAIEGSAQGATN